MNNKGKIKGFSLIELMIVIAIIGIMTALAWQNLNQSKYYSEVDSACNVAASIINKAHNDALAGRIVGGVIPYVWLHNISGFLAIQISDSTTTQFTKVHLNSSGLYCSFSVPFGMKSAGCSGDIVINSRANSNITKTLDISGNVAVCK